MDKNNCDICYKIICKGCGWEPDLDQLALIQKEGLTSCSQCDWSPKTANIASKQI